MPDRGRSCTARTTRRRRCPSSTTRTLKPEKSWTSRADRREATSATGLLRLTALLPRDHAETRSTADQRAGHGPNVTQRAERGQDAHQGARSFRTRYNVGTDVVGARPGPGIQPDLYRSRRIVENAPFPASVGKWQPRVPALALCGLGHLQARRHAGRTHVARTLQRPNSIQHAWTTATSTASPTRAPAATSPSTCACATRSSRQWSAAFGIDNPNNYEFWNFHPYPQRTYSAELRFDL